MEAPDIKILMVWDQGINEVLTRYLKPLGINCVTVHKAEYDPYNYSPEAKRYPVRWSKKLFIMDILKEAITSDIIHVHSCDELIPYLKILHKPILMHYHGSDIRDRWEERKKYWIRVDRILVSTRNLLEGAPENTINQPNPVDTEIFKKIDSIIPMTKALHFDYGAVDLAEKIAKDHGLELDVREKGIPRAEMPTLLNRYLYYIDVKRDYSGRLLVGKPNDTGSLLGLEALACGLTVLNLSGERRGLPPEHQPVAVANKLYEIYEELVK